MTILYFYTKYSLLLKLLVKLSSVMLLFAETLAKIKPKVNRLIRRLIVYMKETLTLVLSGFSCRSILILKGNRSCE